MNFGKEIVWEIKIIRTISIIIPIKGRIIIWRFRRTFERSLSLGDICGINAFENSKIY